MGCKGRITIAGIGPGSQDDITPSVVRAIERADVLVGYKPYFRFVESMRREDCVCIDTGMRQERQRAEEAISRAREGKEVVVISSGDAGIYGMAPLIMEMLSREEENGDIEVEILPGISAFQKAASLLGAPIGGDMCIISLSDLMTGWPLIERRIKAAAEGDFVIAVYNPKSHERYWQVKRMADILMANGRNRETPVGIVRQAGREDESIRIVSLGNLAEEDIDMLTILIIGNSQTFESGGKLITPRGYFPPREDMEAKSKGQDIMIRSFRTIEGEMKNPDIAYDKKWAMLHAIHTTADFEMESLLETYPQNAVEELYEKVRNGSIRTIITDVTMVKSGIRKGALIRLGVEAKCYIDDERAARMAKENYITRAEAGIRLAVEENPDALFAFGNAPTALMELCRLIRSGKAKPQGVIASPVGFVNVRESKHMIRAIGGFPKIIIEGRKGGSSLAATLCNSILTLDDAKTIWPGRDL